MAEDEQKSEDNRKDAKYPESTIPVIFTDGVSSMAWNTDVVKLYMGRLMPDIHAHGPNVQVISHQLVMPRTGFLLTAAFIGRQIEKMLAAGYVTKEELEQLGKNQEELERAREK